MGLCLDILYLFAQKNSNAYKYSLYEMMAELNLFQKCCGSC